MAAAFAGIGALAGSDPGAPGGYRLRRAVQSLADGDLTAVDRRNADRVKRGTYGIDARLDLHGLTQASAHSALRAAVHRGRTHGHRCLLVITGKGLRTEGGKGVLRQQVPLWLNMADLRPHILGFHRAQPRDGGDGALYVLLKRIRDQ